MYLGIIKITSKRTAMHFMDDHFVNLGVGLVRIPFFELRSFGSNPHRIFKASEGGAEHILLSNKGRNLCICLLFSLIKAGICASAVCLHFYYVDNCSSNQLHAWRVCCCRPKGVQSPFWCNMDTRHVQN